MSAYRINKSHTMSAYYIILFCTQETPVSLAGNASISGWKLSFPCAETVVSRLGTGVLTQETSASMIGK